jgi:hypothetical protein
VPPKGCQTFKGRVEISQLQGDGRKTPQARSPGVFCSANGFTQQSAGGSRLLNSADDIVDNLIDQLLVITFGHYANDGLCP